MDVTYALSARKMAGELWTIAATAAELADAEVYRLTRQATHAEVAEALGVSRAAVNKAVWQYNKRAAAARAGEGPE